MPTVIASLGGLNHYSWVFSAYLITSTVTVPVWGKLSDLYGRRLFYQIGIAVFLARLRALGNVHFDDAADRLPRDSGPGRGRARAARHDDHRRHLHARQSARGCRRYFSGVWGLSSVIGPVVGGFITDQLSWRWVFYINLPVGIAAALIIGLALKEPKRTRAARDRLRGRGALDGRHHAADAGAGRRRDELRDAAVAAEPRALRAARRS